MFSYNYDLNLPVDINRLICTYVVDPFYKPGNLRKLCPGFNNLSGLTYEQAEYLLKNKRTYDKEIWKKIKPVICKFLTPREIIVRLAKKRSEKAIGIITEFPDWKNIVYTHAYNSIMDNPCAKKIEKVIIDIDKANGHIVERHRPSGTNDGYIQRIDFEKWNEKLYVDEYKIPKKQQNIKCFLNNNYIYMVPCIFTEIPNTRRINRIAQILLKTKIKVKIHNKNIYKNNQMERILGIYIDATSLDKKKKFIRNTNRNNNKSISKLDTRKKF